MRIPALRRRALVALVTVGLVGASTLAYAEVTTPNPTNLAAVGPISGEHGYPTWYEDSAGLRLQQCLDIEDPMCDPAFLRGEMPNPDAPVNFPDNWPVESFYFLAGASLDMPGGGKGILTSGLEATMANEGVVDGDQVVFGRQRFDIDFPGAGTYEVTHPYGVDTFTVTAGEATDFRYVEDITPAPGNFALSLRSRINPFLVREGGAIVTDKGTYVGDPALTTRVTGSPVNTNLFQVDRVLDDGTRTTVATTDQFTLMGKVSTNSGITPEAAILVETPTVRYLDVFATTGAGDSVSVTGSGLVKTTLDAEGQRYFGRIPLTGTVPDSLTFSNDTDQPVATRNLPVTDGITIASATYDTGTDELTVTARSTDTVDPPTLSLDGITDSTGQPILLVDGTVKITTTAPPAAVTVSSTGGGKASAAVSVMGGVASQPASTIAAISGPTEVLTASSVTLSSGSLNADTLAWTQTAGPDVGVTGQTSESVTFTAPAAAATLEFTLTATGSGGTHTTVAYPISVVTEATPPPSAAVPVALAVATPAQAYVGQSVTVSGSGSTAATSYAWTQTAGPSVPFNSSADGFQVAMPAGGQALTFRLVVTGADGTVSAPSDVTVTPIADVLTITGQVQYRADKTEWRIAGTATVTNVNTVKAYLRNPDGTKGAQVGEAFVDAAGAWGIRSRSGVAAPNNINSLIVESTRGGVLDPVPFTRR